MIGFFDWLKCYDINIYNCYILKYFVKLLIIFLFRIKKNYVVKIIFDRIMENIYNIGKIEIISLDLW